MNTLKFKTNIKCASCEATVTPFLNKVVGEKNWAVDLQSPDKTLSITADNATDDAVIDALKEAGYRANPII